jgi:hypothetical protein
VGLLLVNPLWKHSQSHTQRDALLISEALLYPSKLTMKMNHYTLEFTQTRRPCYRNPEFSFIRNGHFKSGLPGQIRNFCESRKSNCWLREAQCNWISVLYCPELYLSLGFMSSMWVSRMNFRTLVGDGEGAEAHPISLHYILYYWSPSLMYELDIDPEISRFPGVVFIISASWTLMLYSSDSKMNSFEYSELLMPNYLEACDLPVSLWIHEFMSHTMWFLGHKRKDNFS